MKLTRRETVEKATLEILSYLQREANFTRFSAVREIIVRNLGADELQHDQDHCLISGRDMQDEQIEILSDGTVRPASERKQ